MADTEADTLPNGTGALSNEEEDERLKQRPADIDADVREMERRKRVEALMSSKLFREELERVLDQQMHEGNDAPLLQRIREMVGGRLHTGSLRGPSCVLPINDIRGIEGVGYEKGEKILRCKLAAVYRLVDLFGWTQTGASGQITARLNTAVEQLLTTPRGLLPHEVTASSLVKVDMQGVVQDQGTTNFPVNVDGFSLHASVHAARPDIRCVVHVRSAGALAVSATRRGLLPLCNEAALLGDIAYHRVPHGSLDNAERDKLVRALGPSAKVLMLCSGGALCCGSTLEEAFHHARNLAAACDVQLRLAAIPLDDLQLVDEETRKQIYESSRKPPADSTKWRVGGEEFEALMRMLDNAGFRTGYIYRHPLVKNDVPRPKNDVEVPPAVSSLGYLLEEEELYKQGLWKKGQGKTGERTRWLNSPNVYQKVEVLETGTSDPKKITKWVDANNEEWVQDGSPAHSSTPVKIDTLQFVPKNTNPKEFKQLQQQIKENRRADKISAGPQSHILEGVTWDEANKMIGEDAANTHTGDHVDTEQQRKKLAQVLMGAASKGIIQRGYQHNAAVYSAPYARNPFDHVTDTEIDEYKRTVERKQRGQDYDTDLSESEAISAAQITSPASAPSETEEESRDEHRVLRIETKQAPVRSQPEVVLSDVDTTDFLNAERAHADRTKEPERDPNLLSDDEVFLDSAASTATSSVISPEPKPVVVVRSQYATVQQTVIHRGTKVTSEANRPEALTTSQRSLHDYSRSANFDSFVKIYDSPSNSRTEKLHPKCKVSLNSRLMMSDSVKADAIDRPGTSSRGSLYSIPSLEWDNRKPDIFRTRSLPRQRAVSSNNRLFRTRSHGGFINSYIKDPEPIHYHLAKYEPDGTTITLDLKDERKMSHKSKPFSSIHFSVDDIHKQCMEESTFDAHIVKVKEKLVPVFKITTVNNEFVESQEFSEDSYLEDLGNSYSSENRTIIEKKLEIIKKETDVINKEEEIIKKDVENAEIEKDHNVTVESTEGEYHSFIDEMDFEEIVYVSPVKDLVEKDVRNYTVPISFYCEDYGRKNGSPGKSPQKHQDLPKNILEPILEESKSSYGDESNTSNNSNKIDIDAASVVKNVVQEILSRATTASELKIEIATSNSEKITTDTLVTEYIHGKQDTYFVAEEGSDITTNDVESVSINTVQTAVDIYSEQQETLDPEEILDSVYEDVFEILSVDVSEPVNIEKVYMETTKIKENDKSSIDYSTASSNEVRSFDSLAEFEKFEVISDVIGHILNKIDFIDMGNIEKRDVKIGYVANNDISKDNFDTGVSKENVENFSITQMIQDIEIGSDVNDTTVSELSESELSFKVVEAVLYYVLERVYFLYAEKEKSKREKKKKSVVTVVDCEDILFTAVCLWPADSKEFGTNIIDFKDENPEEISGLNIGGAGYNDKEDTRVYTDTDHTVRESTLNIAYIEENISKDNVTDVPLVEFTNESKDLCEQIDPKEESFRKSIDTGLDDVNQICANISEEYSYILDGTTEYHEPEILIAGVIPADFEKYTPEDKATCELCQEKERISDTLNETFILDKEEMNTAFVQENTEDIYSRTSTPDLKDSILESCNESPIKNSKEIFTSDDASIPYEKEDSILGSPFVKQAPVISMSQSINNGGVKYWLSFDEALNETIEKPCKPLRKFEDNKIPSFVAVNFNERTGKTSKNFLERDAFKRSGVLLNDYEAEDSDPANDTFLTAVSNSENYNSDTDKKLTESSPKKRLLYDSSRDLHTKGFKRNSSWPPFEDNLFYRIISKFRMSESFDPSDLDLNNSL